MLSCLNFNQFPFILSSFCIVVPTLSFHTIEHLTELTTEPNATLVKLNRFFFNSIKQTINIAHFRQYFIKYGLFVTATTHSMFIKNKYQNKKYYQFQIYNVRYKTLFFVCAFIRKINKKCSPRLEPLYFTFVLTSQSQSCTCFTLSLPCACDVYQ